MQQDVGRQIHQLVEVCRQRAAGDRRGRCRRAGCRRSSVAAIVSSASEICADVRVVVPSRIIAAAKLGETRSRPADRNSRRRPGSMS